MYVSNSTIIYFLLFPYIALSREAINKRHKKNIITFTGQFFAFLCEMIGYSLFFIKDVDNFKNLSKQYLGLPSHELVPLVALILKSLNTIIFILASPELRRFLFHRILKLPKVSMFDFFVNLFYLSLFLLFCLKFYLLINHIIESSD